MKDNGESTISEIVAEATADLDRADDRTAESARAVAKAAHERLNDLERDLTEYQRQVQVLQEQVAELDSRTDLLSLVDAVDTATGEQRAAALLQHLRRKAESNRNDSARLTHDQAEAALHHPDVERTTIYKDMRRAARLFGDEDACHYDDGVLTLDLAACDDLSQLPRGE